MPPPMCYVAQTASLCFLFRIPYATLMQKVSRAVTKDEKEERLDLFHMTVLDGHIHNCQK